VDPLRHFAAIWAVDFEFSAQAGERPTPLCVVARELRTGRTERRWLDGAGAKAPPYGTGPDTLFIAYYASAELGCHLALGWPMPARILDLYAEFRNLAAGLPVPCGHGLLGALAYHGLPALDAVEKDTMRKLAMRGGPYTGSEQADLLNYCATDVDALTRLLPVMLPKIDLPRALLRGRYMAAAAHMEWNGIPLDVNGLARLRSEWHKLKSKIVRTVNERYGVFEPVRSRLLSPSSAFGSAVRATANANGVDPFDLADAVDMVWKQERAEYDRTRQAMRDARQATRLNGRRISQSEDAVHDYSTSPAQDGAARELAGMWPELNIGRDIDPDAPNDDHHAGRSPDRLPEPTPAPRLRHDPEILRRATEQVLAAGSTTTTPTGPLRFSTNRWDAYLARRRIPWPKLDSGALALDDETFREMARLYPTDVGPIRELRHALSQLRLNELAIGSDGRNRCLLSAFASRTSRNQPSNAKFIFGPSTWLRSLIRPEPGRAVAYVDWEQQEFAIAAALSRDRAMMDAYRSGDPYLTFAKQAGVVPADATKQTHKGEREQFKVCALAVQYGMSAEGLARRLNVPPCRGRDLLRLHQQTYPTYWRWSDRVQDQAMLTGRLSTVFGWTVHVGPDANPRSLRNFPMQANGAEMLRLACCLATERGIMVCAPVHDALFVEGAADVIEAVVADTQTAMREASELVLPGFALRTDAKIVRHPDRYVDDRGREFWETVWGLLDGGETCPTGGTGVVPSVGHPPSLISSLPM
jgi:hypothetical protein